MLVGKRTAIGVTVVNTDTGEKVTVSEEEFRSRWEGKVIGMIRAEYSGNKVWSDDTVRFNRTELNEYKVTDLLTYKSILVSEKQLDDVYTKNKEKFECSYGTDTNSRAYKMLLAGEKLKVTNCSQVTPNFKSKYIRLQGYIYGSIEIPDEFEKIDIEAFEDLNMNPNTTTNNSGSREIEIVVPMGVKKIRRIILHNNCSVGLVIPPTCTSIGKIEAKEGIIHNLYFPNGLKELPEVKGYCTRIECGTGAGEPIYIKKGCCYGRTSLKRVFFNNGIKFLGEKAFYMCRQLVSITGIETRTVIENINALEKTGLSDSTIRRLYRTATNVGGFS